MKKEDRKQAMLDCVELACRVVTQSAVTTPDNRAAAIKQTAAKMYPQITAGKLGLADAMAEIMYLTEV